MEQLQRDEVYLIAKGPVSYYYINGSEIEMSMSVAN